MEMSKMLGAGRIWQMTKHVIPNIMHLVLMIAAGIMGNVIMMEASLSFLGFGMSPTTPDWGAMLTSSGRSSMYNAPWLAHYSGPCHCAADIRGGPAGRRHPGHSGPPPEGWRSPTTGQKEKIIRGASLPGIRAG